MTLAPEQARSDVLAPRIYGDPAAEKMEMPVIKRWFAEKCDATLRLDYPLTANSIVLDVGGYEGNWAAQIHERYGCTIHVFEPVPAFADNIAARFHGNPKIIVHRFGLSDRTGSSVISLDHDSTSVHKSKGTPCTIALKSAADAFPTLGLAGNIDLIKINIEGCEYELLAHLADTGLVRQLRDIQVQFHDFVPNAPQRMLAIQKTLARTHELTWQYRFVWENWRRRDRSSL